MKCSPTSRLRSCSPRHRPSRLRPHLRGLHGAETSGFIIECSYLEIYNTLNDLLGGKRTADARKPGTGLTVEGLATRWSYLSEDEGLARGNAKPWSPREDERSIVARPRIFTMYVKEILALAKRRPKPT